MRIDIHDEGNHFAEQTRVYAEYRVFSALVNRSDVVRHATVRLSRARGDGVRDKTDRVSCSVSITLETGRQVDLATRGQHPHAAIDHLARRIAAALDTDARTVHSNAGGP